MGGEVSPDRTRRVQVVSPIIRKTELGQCRSLTVGPLGLPSRLQPSLTWRLRRCRRPTPWGPFRRKRVCYPRRGSASSRVLALQNHCAGARSGCHQEFPGSRLPRGDTTVPQGSLALGQGHLGVRGRHLSHPPCCRVTASPGVCVPGTSTLLSSWSSPHPTPSANTVASVFDCLSKSSSQTALKALSRQVILCCILS